MVAGTSYRAVPACVADREPHAPTSALPAVGMSAHAPTLTFMEPLPVAGLAVLWGELPGHRRPFEVVLIVPREDENEPLVPRVLPPEVLGCWSADQVIVSAAVLASGPTGAIAAVESLVPELTRSAGASVTVRAADSPGAALVASGGVRDCGAHSGCTLSTTPATARESVRMEYPVGFLDGCPPGP
jgi:hypothetical protein